MSEQTTDTTSILIIDEDAALAGQLRDMIEILDRPSVRVAGLADWHDVVAEDGLTLAAVFLGSGLSEQQADTLLSELTNRAPDVPVVVVEGDGSHDDK